MIIINISCIVNDLDITIWKLEFILFNIFKFQFHKLGYTNWNANEKEQQMQQQHTKNTTKIKNNLNTIKMRVFFINKFFNFNYII